MTSHRAFSSAFPSSRPQEQSLFLLAAYGISGSVLGNPACAAVLSLWQPWECGPLSSVYSLLTVTPGGGHARLYGLALLNLPWLPTATGPKAVLVLLRSWPASLSRPGSLATPALWPDLAKLPSGLSAPVVTLLAIHAPRAGSEAFIAYAVCIGTQPGTQGSVSLLNE